MAHGVSFPQLSTRDLAHYMPTCKETIGLHADSVYLAERIPQALYLQELILSSLTHICLRVSLLNLLSESMILLKITTKLRVILGRLSKRVAISVFTNMSPSNVFQIFPLAEKYYQNCCFWLLQA